MEPMPMGPGEVDGLEPPEAAVDAVSLLRSETEDAVLTGVVWVAVTGVTDASVTVGAADAWVTAAGGWLLCTTWCLLPALLLAATLFRARGRA
jgi:hypothetical protein